MDFQRITHKKKIKFLVTNFKISEICKSTLQKISQRMRKTSLAMRNRARTSHFELILQNSYPFEHVIVRRLKFIGIFFDKGKVTHEANITHFPRVIGLRQSKNFSEARRRGSGRWRANPYSGSNN